MSLHLSRYLVLASLFLYGCGEIASAGAPEQVSVEAAIANCHLNQRMYVTITENMTLFQVNYSRDDNYQPPGIVFIQVYDRPIILDGRNTVIGYSRTGFEILPGTNMMNHLEFGFTTGYSEMNANGESQLYLNNLPEYCFENQGLGNINSFAR